jgi:hypothetical protein
VLFLVRRVLPDGATAQSRRLRHRMRALFEDEVPAERHTTSVFASAWLACGIWARQFLLPGRLLAVTMCVPGYRSQLPTLHTDETR